MLNIALGVGFGSAEAFTRAFRARFDCSPTEWRKSKRGQTASKRGQAARRSRRKNGALTPKETAMKVTIIERPPVHVAYLRHIGPYGSAIGRFWMETVAPWMSTNNLIGRERFGIALDDPTVTAPAKCRYDACVQSDAKEMLSGDPARKMIPGGKYAALAFEGTGAEIGAAWDALLRDWLPKSGLQLDSRPFFEHYPRRWRATTRRPGSFTCNICVPVTRSVRRLRAGDTGKSPSAGARRSCRDRRLVYCSVAGSAGVSVGSVSSLSSLPSALTPIFTVPPAASLPNSSSSASGRLICSCMSRAIGRAPIFGS